MSYIPIDPGPRSTRFPFHGTDGVLGAYGLGAVDPRLGSPPPGTPNPAAWVTAFSQENIADAFVQSLQRSGIRYSHGRYVGAVRDLESTLERLAAAAGTTTLSKAQTRQLLLGSYMQVRRAAREMRRMAGVNTPGARQVASRLMAANARLLNAAGQLLRTAAQSGALKGLGQASPVWLLLGPAGLLVMTVINVRALLGATQELANAQADYRRCVDDPACTPAERTELARRLRIEAERARDESSWNPFEPVIRSIAKVVRITALVGIGALSLYLLWAFGPTLIGFGKRMREKGGKRRESRVAANRRRKPRRGKAGSRRRTTRRPRTTRRNPRESPDEVARGVLGPRYLQMKREGWKAVRKRLKPGQRRSDLDMVGPLTGAKAGQLLDRGVMLVRRKKGARTRKNQDAATEAKRAAQLMQSCPTTVRQPWPRGLRRRLDSAEPGLYRYADGKLTRFRTKSWSGMMDATRIAAQATGESHYWADNRDPERPVLLREYGGDGKARYRVEEGAGRCLVELGMAA